MFNPVKTIKELNRQLKEATACANSPYCTLAQKVEAIKRMRELKDLRWEHKRNQMIKDLENS